MSDSGETDNQFHHHVPKFYLRGWRVDVGSLKKRIWVYRNDSEPKPSSIRRVGGRSGMYNVHKWDGSVDSKTVELFTGTIESKAGIVFPKIFNHEALTSKDRAAVAELMSLAYRRDPYTFDRFIPEKLAPMIPNFRDELRREVEALDFPESSKAKVLEEIDASTDTSSDRLNSLAALSVMSTERMAKFFASKIMRWAFVISEDGKFLTSDCPFVFDRVHGMRYDVFSDFLFPISKHIVLWVNRWMPASGSYTVVPRRVVDQLNLKIIRNSFEEVYANFSSTDIQKLVNREIGRGLPIEKAYTSELDETPV